MSSPSKNADPSAPSTAGLGAPQWALFIVLGLAIVVGYGGYFYLRPMDRTAIEFHAPPSSEERVTNRVVVRDSQRRIWSVDPESRKRTLLSSAFIECSLPAWSPDGAYVGFIGTNAQGQHGIFMIPATGGDPVRVIPNPEEDLEFFDWSPDSQWIAYRRQSDQIASGFVVPLANSANTYSVPFRFHAYWNWSLYDSALLWHVDGEVRKMHRKHPDPIRIPNDQNRSLFRAPAWLGADGGFVYTKYVDGKRSMVSYIPELPEPVVLHQNPEINTLAGAPNGDYVAMLNYKHGNYGVLDILSPERRKFYMERSVRAVFWSPDSRYLAVWSNQVYRPDRDDTRLLTLPDDVAAEDGAETLWILDPDEETMVPLIDFVPTATISAMISRFSQFQHSHSLWSPDSRQLLVPSQSPDGGESKIWLVTIDGSAPPTALCEGEFASWTAQ